MNLFDFLSNTSISILRTRVYKSSVTAEDKERSLRRMTSKKGEKKTDTVN